MSEITLDSISQKLDAIQKGLDKIEIREFKDPYESTVTKELNTALAMAMKEYKTIEYNRKDSYYGDAYSDLNGILTIIRPILSDHELSITQRTILSRDGSTTLQTRLWHSSGEWIETRARIIPSKNDLHTLGSSLQYNKRYQLMALLGITIKNDAIDDDAELDMASSRERIAKGVDPSGSYSAKKESSDTISKDQIEELEYLLAPYVDLAEDVLNNCRIQSIADLPKSKFKAVQTRIKKVIDLRDKNRPI